MTYQSPSQVGTWNGWTEPVPPPPSFSEIRHGLAVEIDRELANLPIQQQTAIVAVCHVGEDAWTVDILNAPPPRGKYDIWTDCRIDFDQYVGSTESIRQGVAEALAYDLMNQTFPGWRDPNYGQPEPGWEEHWH